MPFSVTRSIDITLTDQVEEGIRVAIERGDYKPGDCLPTTREIAKALGVGRVVVERALMRLKKRNYLSARPRMGIVVLDSGVKLWRGTVLIVSTSHSGSYYPNVIASEIKSRLLGANFFCLQVSAESFSAGNADLSALKAYLRGHVDLAVEIFGTRVVEKCISEAEVPFFVIGGHKRPRRQCRGSIGVDWNMALPEFIAHCKAAGVSRVLQVIMGDHREKADVSSALVREGIACERLVVKASAAEPKPSNAERAAFLALRGFLGKCERGAEQLPDLVFFSDDHLAKGALWAFVEARVAVPDKVKIVTWANRGDEPSFSGSLTMMEMDPRAHGQRVSDCILSWLEKRRQPREMTLGPEYRRGDSFP